MKLNICMITYNHAPFIGEAIESVMMQNTNFDFKLIIGEDCSTDSTLAVCQKYQSKYPDKIELLPSDKNRGMMPNFLRTLHACDAEYVAMLEGDDYWTDVNKLQQQVEFMDSNPDFAICFHNTLEKYDDISGSDFLYVKEMGREVFEQRDLFTHMNFIPTCSAVFRNGLIKKYPEWFVKLGMGDWSIHILNSTHGKIKYINKTMGVHRLHSGGIWTGSGGLSNYLHVLEALEVFKQNYSRLYKKEISNAIAKITRHIFEVYMVEKKYKLALKYNYYWFKHVEKLDSNDWVELIKTFVKSIIK